MDVEVVHDKVPAGGTRVTLNRVVDMVGKVLFGTARATGGRHHLPVGDIEVGDQAQGCVANVLELPAFYLAGGQRQAGMFAL